jgi:hypothetical protein
VDNGRDTTPGAADGGRLQNLLHTPDRPFTFWSRLLAALLFVMVLLFAPGPRGPAQADRCEPIPAEQGDHWREAPFHHIEILLDTSARIRPDAVLYDATFYTNGPSWFFSKRMWWRSFRVRIDLRDYTTLRMFGSSQVRLVGVDGETDLVDAETVPVVSTVRDGVRLLAYTLEGRVMTIELDCVVRIDWRPEQRP